MENRLALHEELCNILGSRNVYFQPPENIKINYPAIVYARHKIENLHADDIVYKQNKSYQITVIDRDPDSEAVNKISQLPMCTHNTNFVSDNLNHDVFTLYY